MQHLAKAMTLVGIEKVKSIKISNQVSDQVMKTLNTVWKAVQKRNPELPDVFMVAQMSGQSGKGTTLGHYRYGGWSVRDELAVPEVMLSGECLRQNGEGILKTIIHEASHGLAHVRGVKDVSRQNRYHNKKFVQHAEELGMEYTLDKPDNTHGYTGVTLRSETVELYKEEIALLDAMPVSLGVVRSPRAKRGIPRVRAICHCKGRNGRKKDVEGNANPWINFGATVWEEISPLICGTCHETYVEYYEEDFIVDED